MKSLLVIVAVAFLIAAIPAYADTDFSMFRNADGPHEGHTYRAFDHYENGTAHTEVGYSYVGGVDDIEDFFISGVFTDINGTLGPTLFQTKSLVTPNEVFSLFFENPIPGDVSRFDYSIFGGTYITAPIVEPTNSTNNVPTHESEATSICHDGVIIQAYSDDLREHVRHGDQINSCPVLPPTNSTSPPPVVAPEPEPIRSTSAGTPIAEKYTIPSTTPTPAETSYSSFSTAQLTVMLGEIFAELLSR